MAANAPSFNPAAPPLQGQQTSEACSMVNVGKLIESLFITLEKDIYVLIRIEFLVAVVTAMFLVMFVLDIYRCRSRSSTITTIMRTVDGLSYLIVLYLIGAMQSSDFTNPMFPVWAIVLISLHSSLGYLSRYSIMDREWRLKEVSNVIKSIGSAVLNDTIGKEFAGPLWSLWAILQLRNIYRYFAHRRAVKSLWHGRSSEFFREYLHMGDDDDHKQSNDFDNSKRYLVYGESNRKINIKRPRYVLHLDDGNRASLITLDKIWKYSSQSLLSSSNSCRYKDMSLAFSLSRLLRCRLEDVSLHSESIPRTRHLITSEIIGNQLAVAEPEVEVAQAARRAFRILELEHAFVKDYFYTFYPMVFWRGLFSLSLSLLQSIATICVTFWLAVDIRKVYRSTCISVNKKEKKTVGLHVGGHSIDVIITWVFLFFMIFKEIWEMVTYLLSNWTGLLLMCKYVRNQRWCLGNEGLTKNLTCSFFTSKVADPWHGCIDQYEFLQSCTYKPTFWKLAHTVTLGVIPKKSDGKIPGDAIKIRECVKSAVLQELRHVDLTGHQLHRDSFSRFARYEWALLKLHTCSRVILVWHIATSLCEIKLAQDKHIDLGKPRCSAWSSVRKLSSFSSLPFLVDDNTLLPGRLQDNYRTANSLSRYCAYLQVFQSELLPDSFFVPKVIFEKTLQYACKKLKDCDKTECRYIKLMAIAEEAVQYCEDGKLNMNIVQQGAILANDLIKHEEEENRWKILAEVWAGLLVHIAPSWNAEAHKSKIQSGGEFITLLWALLWHCGIEKSSRWHEDNASKSNAQAPQEDSTETRTTQFAEEQANVDETESCEDPETNNFRTDTTEQAQRESLAKKGTPPCSFTN